VAKKRSIAVATLSTAVAAVVVLAVACTDGATSPKPTDMSIRNINNELDVADIVTARATLRSRTGLYRLPRLKAPLKNVKAGARTWAPASAFVLDSADTTHPTRVVKHARLSAMNRSANRSASLAARNPARVGLGAGAGDSVGARTDEGAGALSRLELGTVHGKTYSILSVRDVQPGARPPHLEVIFMNGKPAIAMRHEFARRAGAWVEKATIVSTYDSTGAMTASVRFDPHRKNPLNVSSTESWGTRFGSALDALATAAKVAILPKPLYAETLACSGDCTALKDKLATDVAEAVAAALAASVAADACFESVGFWTTACRTAYGLVVAYAAKCQASVDDYNAWQACKNGTGSPNVIANGGLHANRIAAPRARSTAATQPLDASLDLGHLNRQGQWVRETVRLHSAPALGGTSAVPLPSLR
jgi:hypothetical protein